MTTVHYLFSTSNLIGSKIIRWGTKHLEPEIKNTPSHVAILVNEKWVFESTLESGVKRISYDKWKEKNKEVGKYKCQTKRELSEVIDYFRSVNGKKYDYFALIYFSIYVGLNKFFGIKIPKKNKWNRKNSYFCSEVMGEMLGLDYQMTAPVQIMAQAQKLLTKNLFLE